MTRAASCLGALACALACTVCARDACALGFADLDVEARARVVPVAERAWIAGRPVSLWAVQRSGAIDEALTAYRAGIARAGHPVVAASHGPWRVLSWRDGTWLHTLQLRAGAGEVRGWLSRWSIERAARIATGAALLPEAMHEARSFVSRDGDARSTTVFAASPAGVAASAAHLHTHLAASGFAATALPVSLRNSNERIWLSYRRASTAVLAMLRGGDGGTLVVMHVQERP